jgi:serine/threonine-protein kinase RsbW
MPRLTLPAQMTSLTPGIAFVGACAAAAGFPPPRVAAVELAVEEALVNICQYAYGHSAGEVEVHCTQDAAALFVIELIDSGKPFDISAAPQPDLSVDLEDRQVGGLGIVLIRAMVDQVTYLRDGNRNILRLAIHLPS